MTDRPILFSGPMVRALIAGTKTQTRRDLMKSFERYPQLQGYDTNGTLKPINGRRVPCVEFAHSQLGLWDPEANPNGLSGWYVPLKAAVGDRLYVREAWRVAAGYDGHSPAKSHKGKPVLPNFAVVAYEADTLPEGVGKLRQAMHLPRWASRLTLTVTDVRVERLQNISDEDAIAEGIERSERFPDRFMTPAGDYAVPVVAYQRLWESINGPGSWDANPWIVAYTFTVHHGNIDTLSKEAA